LFLIARAETSLEARDEPPDEVGPQPMSVHDLVELARRRAAELVDRGIAVLAKEERKELAAQRRELPDLHLPPARASRSRAST
jgi:hypothetical protein